MTKFRYTIDNQTIEVLDVNLIPAGISYVSFEDVEEDNQPYLIQQALVIDIEYTNDISKLLGKHVEKWAIEGVAIPQDVIDERDRLRSECNEKILALGVTDFSYRHSQLNL